MRATGSRCQVLGFVGEPMSGVSYVRFYQPFGHLKDLGFVLRTLGRELQLERGPTGYALGASHFEGTDVLVFPQMVASPRLRDGTRLDLVRPACELAASEGIKIIYSVDDYLSEIEGHNPGFERVRDSKENLRVILQHADALFVTTPALRESLSKHGKPIHVLPNAIDPSRWTQRPRTSGELRVGWAGSSSHIEDLLMILPAIRMLQQRVSCRFLLLGLTDRPISVEAAAARKMQRLESSQRVRATAFLRLVEMLDGIEHNHVPFTRLESYFEALPGLDLDIGLCPLADTEFNRHKSALKFYEYAACGTMTVASAVAPYEDEVTALAANDPDEWCARLEYWLRNPGKRNDELERQRAFVLGQRSIEQLRFQWAESLWQTLGRSPALHPASGAAGRGGSASCQARRN